MRGLGGGAAIIAALMLVAGQADAKCVPSKYTDGWLLEQEQLGGDTMDLHVGHSASELLAHLAKEPAAPSVSSFPDPRTAGQVINAALRPDEHARSEEHTSELQSLMRISYAVFCLKKKNKHKTHQSILDIKCTKHTIPM